MELLSNGTGLTAVVFLPLISALILTAIPKKQELLKQEQEKTLKEEIKTE